MAVLAVAINDHVSLCKETENVLRNKNNTVSE